ncbi:hypothetical protein FG386_000618 [Cryptosporidium ryanae]|uniref:uncharacterized protein n=1 Tax=Cryptosporidium ryanae TaxID=515981 RepID=UPI00351A3B6B|nr:hypothetical protein FG386_000618 [Cryptosporidium ryanae]
MKNSNVNEEKITNGYEDHNKTNTKEINEGSMRGEIDFTTELSEIEYFMKKDKKRLKIKTEEVAILENLILSGEYSECLEKLLTHYNNGNLFENYLTDLIPDRIEYKYNNKILFNSSENHLYDIPGIIILGLIIHCYICKNDSMGAFHIIKKFEKACFVSNNHEFGQSINSVDQNGNNENNNFKEVKNNELTNSFISFCNCFSLDIITSELIFQKKTSENLRYCKHIFKLAEIFYFFRIQILFWKLTMYKSYKIPSISLFQPDYDNNTGYNQTCSTSKYISSIDSVENIKIEDYCIFYDQSIDELYLLINEIGNILNIVKNKKKSFKEKNEILDMKKNKKCEGVNCSNDIFSTEDLDYDYILKCWTFKYKVVLLILVEALTLKDYYQEATDIIKDSIENYFPEDNISLLSLIVRVSLQHGNFKLAKKVIMKMEDSIQDQKHNNNVNIAHYRFTLGLFNMAQDDPVTASLNFNTSAALYKEMANSLNEDYLLPCCVSLNNLSVASFYSSKLANSVSILENQIYNQNNFFSKSQKLFTTNFKNLKTLYQFSPEKDKLINELNVVSKNALRYTILINS